MPGRGDASLTSQRIGVVPPPIFSRGVHDEPQATAEEQVTRDYFDADEQWPGCAFDWVDADCAYRMIFKSKISTPLKEPWHAVSVVGQSEACPASRELRDKRYLSSEAPSLPLPQCSSPSLCKCVYRHYSDRRSLTFRRETDRGQYPRPWVGKNRREGPQSHGRRADDPA